MKTPRETVGRWLATSNPQAFVAGLMLALVAAVLVHLVLIPWHLIMKVFRGGGLAAIASFIADYHLGFLICVGCGIALALAALGWLVQEQDKIH